MIGRSLLAEDFNSRRHEQSSTLPISVDVPCETVIANIHLTQAGEDCLCAVIEVGRDEFLPLFYQSLGFLACRIKVTILAKFTKNIGTFAVQQLPLGIMRLLFPHIRYKHQIPPSAALLQQHILFWRF